MARPPSRARGLRYSGTVKAVRIGLLGGEEPAFGLMKEAIERGKPVVTANKRVVSWHGPELHDLAARKGVELRYEAAVGGGIPLLAPLADDLAANRLLELRAIINGTTNYILTQMAGGSSFQDALARAQKLGYAEADPSDDVDAVDAADKLAILVRIAFGVSCTPKEIFREGVRALDPIDLAYGREMGYALKLLAIARRGEGGSGLASVIQREPVSGQADVVLMTYAAREAALREAQRRLAALPTTRSVRARIRVEESRT